MAEGHDRDAETCGDPGGGRGRLQPAIRALRDEKDADCRSVLLSIIAKHKGDTAALDWFRDQSLSPADLTPNGIIALCQIHLRRQDFAAVKQILAGLSDLQFRESPYFLFFRGVVRFAAVLSRPEQGVALTGLPLDARFVQPILPDRQLEAELDAAHSDLERFLSASEGLELREAPRLAEAYLTWCDLLHPRRRDAALVQLRSDMADPAKALSRVQFALAYDADNFDREPLAKYLQKREALGGLNSDELRAALVLRLHADDPGAIVELIAKHRAQFDEGFAKFGIVAIEIHALALAHDVASAKLLLEANRELLGPEGVARLGAEIARAEGADPVAEYKRVYEVNKSADTLRLLLGALIQKKEHRAVGPYAEELFALTDNPHDIAAAAQAYASVGDNDNFMRVVEAHPAIKRSDPGIESRLRMAALSARPYQRGDSRCRRTRPRRLGARPQSRSRHRPRNGRLGDACPPPRGFRRRSVQTSRRGVDSGRTSCSGLGSRPPARSHRRSGRQRWGRSECADRRLHFGP